MGCDIWAFCERRNKETNKWENLSLYKKNDDGKYSSVDIYDGRDYDLFGILAGVRSCISPFVFPRGVPDDLSDEVKDAYGDGDFFHSATWYDWCELSAYEYMMIDSCKEIEKRDKQIESLIKLTKQLACQNKDEEDIDDDIECEDESPKLWERLEDFMDCIRRVLDAYNIWKYEPGDVRVVIWFDN